MRTAALRWSKLPCGGGGGQHTDAADLARELLRGVVGQERSFPCPRAHRVRYLPRKAASDLGLQWLRAQILRRAALNFSVSRFRLSEP